ncbi:hypothetical protein [Eleftheria terrae]|uniref:hypothetical protein n=1 Tax=Eleftheria terrae TaxID=1597781 RepID=UPI00263B79A9|nr:hypothetical protein [Eleftheria terrae]WKB50562.1 hypothetical protein N7L95_00140 [Eleftheria terrae]
MTQDAADAEQGMQWWNGMTDAERRRWALAVRTGVAADAWRLYQRSAQLGQRIEGRCVSMGTTYVGTVVEVIPVYGEYEPRYRLADTGARYSDGGPIEPTVFRIGGAPASA